MRATATSLHVAIAGNVVCGALDAEDALPCLKAAPLTTLGLHVQCVLPFIRIKYSHMPCYVWSSSVYSLCDHFFTGSTTVLVHIGVEPLGSSSWFDAINRAHVEEITDSHGSFQYSISGFASEQQVPTRGFNPSRTHESSRPAFPSMEIRHGAAHQGVCCRSSCASHVPWRQLKHDSEAAQSSAVIAIGAVDGAMTGA